MSDFEYIVNSTLVSNILFQSNTHAYPNICGSTLWDDVFVIWSGSTLRTLFNDDANIGNKIIRC
jgi:hypothetical protein